MTDRPRTHSLSMLFDSLLAGLTAAGTDVWERAAVEYADAGAPYGDTRAGLLRWLDEQPRGGAGEPSP